MGGRCQHDLGHLPRWGVFPPDWLSKHINQKMYDLYHLLRQFCTRHPGVLRRAFNRGRAKNRETHALLVQLFASGIRLHVIIEVDPDGRQRGHGRNLAAVTRSHNSHSARSVQSNIGWARLT